MDNFLSQSLINAAFTSLSGGIPAVTAGALGVMAGAAIGGVFPFGPSITDVVKLYYSSLVISVSATGQCTPRPFFQGLLEMDKTSLAPEFNHDFTNIRDVGKTYVRGNQPYERPCGSYRVALKVEDKFGKDNAWLSMRGNNLDEWPVSYHGTAQHHALNIAEEGYKISKGKRFRYGKGIYSTPEVAVAKLYTEQFQHEGASYSSILQNRVNPKYLKVIPKEENGVGTYWVSAADKDEVDESELLRPYGMCLFKEY